MSNLDTHKIRKIVRFRTTNHRFPIELEDSLASPDKIEISEIDEFHYILSCKVLDIEKHAYLKKIAAQTKYHQILRVIHQNIPICY